MQKAQAVGRVLWRLGNRHQAVRGGVAAAKTVGKAAARSTRILMLEITGFFFAIFSLLGLAEAWKHWREIQNGTSAVPSWQLWIPVAFGVVFAYFAITSFWRAKREARG